MSEWFKKEAGFRYKVEAMVRLHYMDRYEESGDEEDGPTPFKDFETLDAALNEANAYVNCDGAYGRCPECGGKPFEATATRYGIGSYEERYASVVRIGLAANPNDPEDKGEWKACDENGTFWYERGCGDITVVKCLTATPRQVQDAWDRAKRSYRDYLDGKRESYTDVVIELGLQGRGWHSFTPFDEEGLPVVAKKAPAVWIDDKKDFMKNFSAASEHARGSEVAVKWHGSEVFPDEDRDVQWGTFDQAKSELWQKVRMVVGKMTRGEAKNFLHDLRIVIESGELDDEFDVAEAAETAKTPEEMAARTHEVAKRVAPQRVRD